MMISGNSKRSLYTVDFANNNSEEYSVKTKNNASDEESSGEKRMHPRDTYRSRSVRGHKGRVT